MTDSLRTAQHVLKTYPDKVEILSFNSKNELMARFEYKTREGALNAIEKMIGRKITLKPMQTVNSERVEVFNEVIDDANTPDE